MGRGSITTVSAPPKDETSQPIVAPVLESEIISEQKTEEKHNAPVEIATPNPGDKSAEKPGKLVLSKKAPRAGARRRINR